MPTTRWILLLCLLAGLLTACAPSSAAAGASDEQAIRDAFDAFSANVAARDVDAIMTLYAPDVVAFDAFPPRQYVGAAAYRLAYEGFFAAFPGPVTSEVSDVHIETAGTLAYAHGIDRWVATTADGQPVEVVFRFTNVLRKTRGQWLVIHEHLSVPVDPVSGMGDFLSTP